MKQKVKRMVCKNCGAVITAPEDEVIDECPVCEAKLGGKRE